MSRKSPDQQWVRGTFHLLKKILAVFLRNISLSPEKCLCTSNNQIATSPTSVARSAFLALSNLRRVEMNSAPQGILLDLNQVNLFNGLKCIKAAVDFALFVGIQFVRN